MSFASISPRVLKKFLDNKTKVSHFQNEPQDATVCVLFTYYRIHDFLTVINDHVGLELVLNGLIIVTDKKCKAVRTIPLHWENYTPPVNTHTHNEGWHYNEEWLFHNALAEHCIFRYFKPMEEVFHIFANHPTVLLSDDFFRNKIYASIIRFFEYIDATDKHCPLFLVPCYTYYKKVRVYFRKHHHFLHLCLLRKSLPVELNNVIMSYL